jgi:ABC-type bacteriocin/lantibiotic exporter with double-glycine peptidase domain
VVLARAQIHDSQLIFIDEGTSAIDAHNGLRILQNLLQTDATIVFIAHNLTEEMRQLFDREIHLSNTAGVVNEKKRASLACPLFALLIFS